MKAPAKETERKGSSVNQQSNDKTGSSHPPQKQNIPRPEPASWERQRRKLGRV